MTAEWRDNGDVDAEPSAPELDALLRALAHTPERAPDPTKLLHYRIIAKLGEGGMGAVYKARDTKLGRVVAIKRVAAHVGGDDGARRRLLFEARAASALSHPSIVTIHAVEEADGVDFIVMELVDGEPLDAVLARGPLDADCAIRIGACVADALACAHAAGVVHRDIKPANVIVTAHGAKVLDFGIAKPVLGRAVSHDEATGMALTSPGAIVGTVPYMSPEQLGGAHVDARSDLFSLGALLYEALTGKRAFPGRDLSSCMREVLMVDPPPPSRDAPDVPASLDVIVMRALAKDPARRFAAAGEMADALRAASVAPASAHANTVGPSRRADSEALLLGREAELRELTEHFDRAGLGQGGLAFVSGEAGIGKTALVDALVRRASMIAPAVVVARGRCIEQFGDGAAYLPLLDLLDDLLAGSHARIAKETLLGVAPTWALELPATQSTGAIDALQRGSFGANKERMIRELGDTVAALATRAPLLLLLEDIHCADPSTVDAIRHLAHRLDRHRVLLVATLRPADLEARSHPLRAALADWRAKNAVAEVRLGVLTEAAVQDWLDARFTPNDFAPALAAAVHARSEGHALFVASILDWLVREERIKKSDRGWHADRVDAASLGVPESLREMLGARLDALLPEDRQLLAVASVQGPEVSSIVLADLAEIDEVTVEEHLARIAAKQRLVRAVGEQELPDGMLATRWRFAHALYRDLLYGELSVKRRALLHQKAGESLLQHHGDDAARLAAVLAVHFEQGRDFARATEQLRRAGDNAMRVFASVEAEAHYARAAACAARLPAADRDRTLVAIHRQRALALTAMSRYDAAIEELEAALTRAESCGDRTLAGETHVALADVMFASHRLDAAAPHVAAAAVAAEECGDPSLRIDALSMRALERLIVGDLDACQATLAVIDNPRPLVTHLQGLLHYFRSEYADAERAFARAVAQNEQALADGLLLMESRMFGALAVANLGRLGEAMVVLDATMALARRNESQVMLARAGNSLGWIYRELGMLERATDEDERAAELGRASGETEAEANALVNLGEDRLATPGGDCTRLGDWFARVRELSDSDAWLRWRYGMRLEAARARERLALGALDEALTRTAALRQQATSQRAAKYVAMSWEIEASVALARGETTAALAAIECARGTLVGFSCPLVAWRLEALAARAYERAGDVASEGAARARAGAIVGAISAGLRPKERASFLASPAVREATIHETIRSV